MLIPQAIVQEGGGNGGSGEALVTDIAQTGHGFSVGDVVYFDGANYALAQADDPVTAEVVGIVSAVADVNNFSLHYGGLIDTLSGLIAGDVYFLSPDIAGDLTTSEPGLIGQVSKPLLIANSSTSGYWFNFKGFEVDTSEQVAHLFNYMFFK